MAVVPQAQQVESQGIPAPIQGIVATGIYSGGSASGIASEGSIGVDSAIWLYNMIAGEYACRVRPGSRDIVAGIPDNDGPDGQVRTILYYNSTVAGGIQDFIFALTSSGIYDVTSGGAGPWVPNITWPNTGGNAGWASAINYTNVAGDQYLLVCDEQNGYYIFDGTTWAPGTFTGTTVPLAVNLVHIEEWNGRIWLIERDTATIWFLDPLALTGDITAFNVGNRFKEGGHLVQSSTWTLDAGDGMDDKFIMISSGGDVLVWEGIDPTAPATIRLVGRWTVGSVAEGRRVLSDWGGDVTILSTAGAISVANLLQGTVDTAARASTAFITRGINQYIRAEMQQTLDVYGWSLQLNEPQGIAIISVPQPVGSTRAPIQFVLDIASKSWSMFRDLDIVCQGKRDEQYVFGTSDGRIVELTGTVDKVDINGDGATGIVFSLLTHYSGVNSPAHWKRFHFCRPYWIGPAEPSFDLQMRYDFDIAELNTAPAFQLGGASSWDSAIWDESLWDGTAQGYLETIGVNGMGRHAAIAIRGTATNELSYVGADVIFQRGGML